MSDDVALTRADAQRMPHPPLLVIESLREYLSSVGLSGDLSWARIGDGHSNVTYGLDVGARRLVLRRGPRPPLPPTTHDMLREARVQRLLADAGVPVPRIVAVCDDESVLGVPFYLMERLDGVVVTDAVPAMSASDPAAIAWAAVDALADLHAVDVSQGELATLGRPDGYLSRQVSRFASLWPTVSRRSFVEVDRLAEGLATRVPTSARASVVHGDYRIGNLMLAPEAPVRVQAILDWEMATLGDPLADLGYFLATYAEPGAAVTPLELTPVTRGEGFPSRAQLAERYALRTGADLGALGWYRTLALFKAAVFCEAIYTRWCDGERPGDEFAPRLAEGVPLLLREAEREARGS
ncbi:phosphotransferase family protein [Microbacterium fluvii]|uniref:Phosphotransferase family protein n=1 Tax=Microbacterium fluvii TaxID=415215 RepID=A0ABW2HEM9_9MICO|nr:phosphotransferase family protein [Microbacterium fluvii]MCU4672966.1 phosphotransferase family protein [Microbacterium fluvii]